MAYWSSVLQVRQAVSCFPPPCFDASSNEITEDHVVKAQSPLKMDRIGTGCFKYAACHRTAEALKGQVRDCKDGVPRQKILPIPRALTQTGDAAVCEVQPAV